MYYKCVKFHKNPISGLGGVALTRYMDGRTDRVIPIYPPNFVCRGYKNPAHGENSRHRHHTINMLLVICHDIAVKFMLSCQLMSHNNQLLIFRYSQTSSGADPGFQVRGGALKKIASSGGRRENFWGISCEKSRFYAKKSYFFQLLREARTFLGYFV